MEKNSFGNHQTVDYSQKGILEWWTTIWCTFANFKLQILIQNNIKSSKFPIP